MRCFQSAYSTTCMLVSLRCLRGNRRAQWKAKFTDDHELWPHAISRHQSRESTMLRLEKKKKHDQRLQLLHTGRVRVPHLTERNGHHRTKATNAWELLEQPNQKNCPRKRTAPHWVSRISPHVHSRLEMPVHSLSARSSHERQPF